MRTFVVTAVRGRAVHLRHQLEALARSDHPPAGHVIVAMDDDTVTTTVRENGSAACVIDYHAGTERLQVAGARNLGASTAIGAGAELLVFLDVDCLPAPWMLSRYREAATEQRSTDGLLCGPVTYLPPPEPTGYDIATLSERIDPHPGRRTPGGDAIVRTTDYELFWSLSFALTVPTWNRIGGFCTDYHGYGGEDTDFGQVARSAGVAMYWVGGAHALHQFHPVSDPPVEHLTDILANASVFRRRWGWWPMQGWLNQFQKAGLITWHADGGPSLA